ncbi:MAG: CoA-binding protein [Pseudomonadota bacterium]
MTRKATVETFLGSKRLALVGASSGGKKFGNVILKELSGKGYQVTPVHPTAENIDGHACAHSLGELAERVDGVVLVVPPAQTEKVVEEVAQVGIRRVWMQQGAESDRAVALCHERGIDVVHGECILMFAEPAGVPHRIHRFVWRMLHKLPN